MFTASVSPLLPQERSTNKALLEQLRQGKEEVGTLQRKLEVSHVLCLPICYICSHSSHSFVHTHTHTHSLTHSQDVAGSVGRQEDLEQRVQELEHHRNTAQSVGNQGRGVVLLWFSSPPRLSFPSLSTPHFHALLLSSPSLLFPFPSSLLPLFSLFPPSLLPLFFLSSSSLLPLSFLSSSSLLPLFFLSFSLSPPSLLPLSSFLFLPLRRQRVFVTLSTKSWR